MNAFLKSLKNRLKIPKLFFFRMHERDTTKEHFFDRKAPNCIALLHHKQTVTGKDVLDTNLQKATRNNSKRNTQRVVQYQYLPRVAHKTRKAHATDKN